MRDVMRACGGGSSPDTVVRAMQRRARDGWRHELSRAPATGLSGRSGELIVVRTPPPPRVGSRVGAIDDCVVHHRYRSGLPALRPALCYASRGVVLDIAVVARRRLLDVNCDVSGAAPAAPRARRTSYHLSRAYDPAALVTPLRRSLSRHRSIDMSAEGGAAAFAARARAGAQSSAASLRSPRSDAASGAAAGGSGAGDSAGAGNASASDGRRISAAVQHYVDEASASSASSPPALSPARSASSLSSAAAAPPLLQQQHAMARSASDASVASLAGTTERGGLSSEASLDGGSESSFTLASPLIAPAVDCAVAAGNGTASGSASGSGMAKGSAVHSAARSPYTEQQWSRVDSFFAQQRRAHADVSADANAHTDARGGVGSREHAPRRSEARSASRSGGGGGEEDANASAFARLLRVERELEVSRILAADFKCN